MSQPSQTTPSDLAISVLRDLRLNHNVLIAGCPATGKTRLLTEVRYWFTNNGVPAFSPTGPNAFPANKRIAGAVEWLPSPERTNRKAWEITFHQGTKYRDFMSGIAPKLNQTSTSFQISVGPLYEAVDHAKTQDGVSLVIIDEINRGPAVAIFGDAITAIESDKRLAPNGSETPSTYSFRALNAEGKWQQIAIPHHVYLVAAMNEADTSVEPLDVAFRRRWEPFRLYPEIETVRQFFGLQQTASSLPETPKTRADVLEALVQAWAKVNERAALGRGDEFQLGHGLFMKGDSSTVPKDLDGVLEFATVNWHRILRHVAEVFFGDTRGLAYVVGAQVENSPYKLTEEYFAESPVARLIGPMPVNSGNVYSVLRSAAK